MASVMALAPWLAVAGAGALHGLNPCSGWALAAACGIRSGEVRQALRALGPIACGHAASVGAVAAAVALGSAMGDLWLLAAAAVPGVALLALRWRQRAGRLGLTLGSFIAATLHGSGLMLAPAFVPLCLSASPAREITASGSLLLALAAVGVHMAAMLTVTASMAWAACRATDAATRIRARHPRGPHEHRAPKDPSPAGQPHRQAGTRGLLP